MEAVAAVIRHNLTPLLLGEDPSEIEKLWERMYRATSTFGRRGLPIIAISGVDIALWDLLGKAKGAAVYELLGGRFWNKIPAYASALYPASSAELAREARGYVKQGFSAMKQRLGVDPRTDIQLVKSVHRPGEKKIR